MARQGGRGSDLSAAKITAIAALIASITGFLGWLIPHPDFARVLPLLGRWFGTGTWSMGAVVVITVTACVAGLISAPSTLFTLENPTGASLIRVRWLLLGVVPVPAAMLAILTHFWGVLPWWGLFLLAIWIHLAATATLFTVNIGYNIIHGRPWWWRPPLGPGR